MGKDQRPCPGLDNPEGLTFSKLFGLVSEACLNALFAGSVSWGHVCDNCYFGAMIMTFAKSVRYALAGIVTFFSRERNGQIQGVAAILTLILGFSFGITRSEWLAVILCVCMVLVLEMINSGLEKICNLISIEYHPEIKIIKDIAAGAVLIAACGAAIVGAIIFLPYLSELLGLAAGH